MEVMRKAEFDSDQGLTNPLSNLASPEVASKLTTAGSCPLDPIPAFPASPARSQPGGAPKKRLQSHRSHSTAQPSLALRAPHRHRAKSALGGYALVDV